MNGRAGRLTAYSPGKSSRLRAGETLGADTGCCTTGRTSTTPAAAACCASSMLLAPCIHEGGEESIEGLQNPLCNSVL
jgi:hypothetical protein